MASDQWLLRFRVCGLFKKLETHELLFLLHGRRYCGHFSCLPLWGTYYTIAHGSHTKSSLGSPLLTQVRCKWEPKHQYSVLSRLGALFSFVFPNSIPPIQMHLQDLRNLFIYSWMQTTQGRASYTYLVVNFKHHEQSPALCWGDTCSSSQMGQAYCEVSPHSFLNNFDSTSAVESGFIR